MEAAATRKNCNEGVHRQRGMRSQRGKKRGKKGYLQFAHLQVQRCNIIATKKYKRCRLSAPVCKCSFANSIGLKNHSLRPCPHAH
jgi:hypothetical protein